MPVDRGTRWSAADLRHSDSGARDARVTRALDIPETPPEVYNEVCDFNMRGYCCCAQDAVKSTIERGVGAIINVTSVHCAGFPRHAACAGTKGAIIAVTREPALELAPKHIRVNAIGPGVIDVRRYFDSPDYTREFGNSLLPWGRVGTPADVGHAAVLAKLDHNPGQLTYRSPDGLLPSLYPEIAWYAGFSNLQGDQ